MTADSHLQRSDSAALLDNLREHDGGTLPEIAERMGWDHAKTAVNLDQLKRDKVVRYHSVMGNWWAE